MKKITSKMKLTKVYVSAANINTKSVKDFTFTLCGHNIDNETVLNLFNNHCLSLLHDISTIEYDGYIGFIVKGKIEYTEYRTMNIDDYVRLATKDPYTRRNLITRSIPVSHFYIIKYEKGKTIEYNLVSFENLTETELKKKYFDRYTIVKFIDSDTYLYGLSYDLFYDNSTRCGK